MLLTVTSLLALMRVTRVCPRGRAARRRRARTGSASGPRGAATAHVKSKVNVKTSVKSRLLSKSVRKLYCNRCALQGYPLSAVIPVEYVIL